MIRQQSTSNFSLNSIFNVSLHDPKHAADWNRQDIWLALLNYSGDETESL